MKVSCKAGLSQSPWPRVMRRDRQLKGLGSGVQTSKLAAGKFQTAGMTLRPILKFEDPTPVIRLTHSNSRTFCVVSMLSRDG